MAHKGSRPGTTLPRRGPEPFYEGLPTASKRSKNTLAQLRVRDPIISADQFDGFPLAQDIKIDRCRRRIAETSGSPLPPGACRSGREVLEEKFGALLGWLAFDDEVMEWVRDALHQSHADERREHEAAIERLRGEYDRLQNRIHAAYVDKLDGNIDAAFFEKLSAEWRTEQDRCLRDIERHQSADQSYLEDGVRLFELAQNAQRLFAKQDAREKRRLLNFLVSNCSWRDGELTATLRQPFDLIAETTEIDAKRKAAGEVSNGLSEIWLPGPDSNQRHGG